MRTPSVIELLKNTIEYCEKYPATALAVVTVHSDGTPSTSYTTAGNNNGVALIGGVTLLLHQVTKEAFMEPRWAEETFIDAILADMKLGKTN